MQTAIEQRFQQLMSVNAPIAFNGETAVCLIKRIDCVCLHAHSYSFILNLTHGSMTPFDVLVFAYQHELQGINIRIDDGGKSSLANRDDSALACFKQQDERLNLTIHLVNRPRLHALFDFTNIINVGEQPNFFIKSLPAELKWPAQCFLADKSAATVAKTACAV